MGMSWLKFYSANFQSLNISLVVKMIWQFSEVYCEVQFQDLTIFFVEPKITVEVCHVRK
jgi:hypothetical protein